MTVFLNTLKTCLLCVSLNTPSEKQIFYDYLNLLLLLMASTLFVTSQQRTGTPLLIITPKKIFIFRINDVLLFMDVNRLL